MVDIRTSFVGLNLNSPIIIGSSGLSRNVDKVKALAEAGTGAVIVKSLFEEQILAETASMQSDGDYTEAADYLAHYVRQGEVNRYLEHLTLLKSSVSIPVIASICCISHASWEDFALQMEQASADALEVNIMRLETDLYYSAGQAETLYVQLIKSIKARLRIPIIVKLSRYHTALPALVDKLRAAGADAVTLFNRPYQPDLNLDTEEYSSGGVFTHDGDFADSLRFTALVSGLVGGIEISTSTGVYTWREVTKAILAGAQTTQMCTAIYKSGAVAVSDALMGLRMWMEKHGYQSVDEFRSRLNAKAHPETNVFERVQFLKYFGGQGDKA